MDEKNKLYMLSVKKGEAEKELLLEELNIFKTKYENHYKRKKVKPLFANLTYDGRYTGFTIVKADLLDRVDPISRTLEECDAITTEMENSTEFKRYFNIFTNSWLKPIIAYKNNGIIKTIPVMYKKDKQFLEKDSLKQIITAFALQNPNFIEEINLWPEANDNKGIHMALENLIKAKRRYDSYKDYESENNIGISKTDFIKKLEQFFYQWCNPKNKSGIREYSYRKLRDLACFTSDKINEFEEDKLLKNDKTHTL